MAKKTKTIRRGASQKDVQVAYLLDGLPAVQKLNPSKGSVRAAVEALAAAGRNVDHFRAWSESMFGIPGQGRGRKSPRAGQDRTYRAQQIARGSTFLRLPLDALGVRKGESVSVVFEKDKVVVTRGGVGAGAGLRRVA